MSNFIITFAKMVKNSAKSKSEETMRCMAIPPSDKCWKKRTTTVTSLTKKRTFINFSGKNKNKQIRTDNTRHHSQMFRNDTNLN